MTQSRRLNTMTLIFLGLCWSQVLIISTHAEEMKIEGTVAHEGFDGKTCWVHARAGAIPATSAKGSPLVVMTMQKLLLTGSDVFYALNQTVTDDGVNWTDPKEQTKFARQTFGHSSGHPPIPGADLLIAGDEFTVCDFTPKWHTASQTLLGTGQTVWYRDNHVLRSRPRAVAYAVYDQLKKSWYAWKRLQLPEERKFINAGAGSVQRFDLPNGEILLPIYYKEPDKTQFYTTVLRCQFDGMTLKYIDHGSELTVPVKRGLAEPSLTQFQGRYYLTLRNDVKGYVCSSQDGQHYEKPQPWTFDDGTELGNYNTQQHWVRSPEKLYLVYTRRGLDNDHVFRHRAPLVIAEVDPERLCVIRDTEQILVPEKGARLGNFAITEISPTETWVTVTEWMQPRGVEKYGSDNRVHVVKLTWTH